jgi:hypothetical protein
VCNCTTSADTEEALAKKDEKRRRKKEATAATFIDLTKQAIEAKKMEAAAKLLVEEKRIVFVDFIMDLKQMTWFEKKRTIIHERDA